MVPTKTHWKEKKLKEVLEVINFSFCGLHVYEFFLFLSQTYFLEARRRTDRTVTFAYVLKKTKEEVLATFTEVR